MFDLVTTWWMKRFYPHNKFTFDLLDALSGDKQLTHGQIYKAMGGDPSIARIGQCLWRLRTDGYVLVGRVHVLVDGTHKEKNLYGLTDTGRFFLQDLHRLHAKNPTPE